MINSSLGPLGVSHSLHLGSEMCGVAGLWIPGGHPAAVIESFALSMSAALSHRGPDDHGVWSDPSSGIALSHRRLSVVDPSTAGHQPMRSSSQRYVIAFNGEIYNFRNIRRQLEDSGCLQYPWRGQSDTETLLAAIDAWGLTTALERSSGMFAFALWDRREHLLHLVRDRFGEKPLYWGWLRQGERQLLAFASELSAFRALPGVVKPNINPSALQALFEYGFIPAPLCIYDGIHQLEPGHHLQLSLPDLSLTSHQWWSAQHHAEIALLEQESLLSPEAVLSTLNHVLQQVVSEQSLADVPLGTFLSGGIDSSLVTALIQSQRQHPVRSFTISFPDNPAFNEAPFAAAVAAHLGTDHTEVALTSQDALELIPHLPQLYTEPFADSSQLPTHLVCREARRSGLTVALSGDGGDELFGGYNRHRILPLLQARFGFLPPVMRRVVARFLEHIPVSGQGLALDKRFKLASALRSVGSLEELHRSVLSIWPDPSGSLLQESWAAPSTSPAFPVFEGLTPSEQLMLADVLSYLPADILAKVDRASMAASLETRAPFLDHRVAEIAWRMPLTTKIRGATGKLPLRQLLARYVPPALTERPKAGFAMPIGSWLRGPLRPWAEDLLHPQLLESQGYLQAEPIQRLWQAHQRGADHTRRLWTVLMWQAWLAEWG